MVRLISVWRFKFYSALKLMISPRASYWPFPPSLCLKPLPTHPAQGALAVQLLPRPHTCAFPWCTWFFPASFHQLLLPFFCSSHPKPVQPVVPCEPCRGAFSGSAAGVSHSRDLRAALSCCCLQVCTGICNHSFPAGRLGPDPQFQSGLTQSVAVSGKGEIPASAQLLAQRLEALKGWSIHVWWKQSVWVHWVSTICSQKWWVPESLVGFWVLSK